MSQEESKINIPSLIKMLGELADLAEHASLTGAMASGNARAVARYNAMLKELIDADIVPAGMFQALPADAGFGDLAVDGRLLRAYVKEAGAKPKNGDCCDDFAPEKHLILRLAPFASSSDLHELVESYLAHGSKVDAELVESLAPFLDSSDLGSLIRSIAKRGKGFKVELGLNIEHTSREPSAPKAPEAPQAPQAPHAPHAPHMSHLEKLELHDIEMTHDGDEGEESPEPLAHHDVPVEDRLRALTDRMRDPNTSPEEFEELAAEVLRLKQEQART